MERKMMRGEGVEEEHCLFLKMNYISMGQTVPRVGRKEMLPTVPEFPLMPRLLTLQHEMHGFVHRENCG